MTDPVVTERLDRVEALLAELVRRYTPREAIPALERRLEAYPGLADPEAFRRWLPGDAQPEGEA